MDAQALETFMGVVIGPVSGKFMEYKKSSRNQTHGIHGWNNAQKHLYLAKGIKWGSILRTDTLRIIGVEDTPKECKVTYAIFVCDLQAQKLEPNELCITVGGNHIDYPGGVVTKTANTTIIMFMLNIMVSNL